MNMLSTYPALLLTVMCAGHLFITRRNGLLNANTIFVIVQLMMVIGTYRLITTGDGTATHYAHLMTIATAIYVAASTMFFAVMTKAAPKPRYAILITRPSRATRVLLILSIAIVVLYYSAVGFIPLVQAVKGSGDANTASTLRLDSYSGSRYLYPGYVNQFKNSLLPALTLLYTTFWAMNKPRRIIAMAILWVITVIALVGTGQRGAFVIFTVIAATYLANLDARRFLQRTVVMLACALPVLLIVTSALSRAPQNSPLTQLWYRFMQSNQGSGIAAYRYTSTLPTANGHDWWLSALGLLPHHTGSPLDSDVFATIYGSHRGTAPPSLWGSIIYNFGPAGLVFFPILLAFLIQFLSTRMIHRYSVTTTELVGYAGLTGTIGLWAADGPVYLLNTGFVVWLLIYLVGRSQQPAENPAHNKRMVSRKTFSNQPRRERRQHEPLSR